MAHGHAHHSHLDDVDDRPFEARVRALASRRVLAGVIVAITLGTVIGLIVLWPGDTEPVVTLEGEDYFGERVEASVTEVETGDCSYAQTPGEFTCDAIFFEVTSGSPAGDTDLLEVSHGIGGPTIHQGDEVILYYGASAPSGAQYQFADFQRRAPLTWLAVAFFLVVVAFAKWRGLFAIIGVGVSMLVLVGFMLPALLESEPPVWVALVGTCAVALPALYLAHGISERTSVAVIGTVSSLLFICVLGLTFVHLTHLTGLVDEEVGFLQAFGGDLDFAGLLLAGLVIGALGVLDDVTVTQVAAVWELRVAQPAASGRELYRAGVRIGRDHIASTVNTLVLAYAGASLPLLLLFVSSEQHFGDVITSEAIAAEIVRALVGSIGLVASVPITTGLAALVVTRDATTATTTRSPRAQAQRRRRTAPEPPDQARPRWEDFGPPGETD